MGLSLVAVFAIIATLGLLSLNQATPVEANMHEVGVDTTFTHTFEFNAPEELAKGDDIILVLRDFTVPATPAVKLHVSGAERADGITVARSAMDDETITIALGEAAADIGNGAAIRVMIMDTIDANNVKAPMTQNMYAVSVRIDINRDGVIDYDGLAMDTISVVSAVTEPMVSLTAADEDVESELTISFKLPGSVGLTTIDGDNIQIFLEGFTAPSGLNMDEIDIMATVSGTVQTANPSNAVAAAMTPDRLKTGQLVTLDIGDMSQERGTQNIDDVSDGNMVTVTFNEDSGLMNPSNGGMYTAKVWTSKASEHVVANDEEPFTVMATTPDISRVLLSEGVAGKAAQMSVRFVTDVTLMGGDDADTITLTLPEFTLPQFLPPNSVKINGRDVDVGDSDPDTHELDLPMTHTISADRTVVVTILAAAGIMNPATPDDEYTLMVKTSEEPMNGTSDMFSIMAAPPPVMMPPGDVEVMAEPNTAGSATKLTVQFTTGDEGALAEDDEITVMAQGFDIPVSIDSEDVTVNGANPKSVATGGNEAILTLDAGIPADRRVSVVFKIGAGLTTPAKAGQVEVSVSTTSEGQAAPGKLAIGEPPAAAMIRPIQVVPPVPGEDSRITLKFMTPTRLSSIENSEVIFRFHEDFSVAGGRVDVSKVTIQADSIFGGPEVDTPKASEVTNPTSATVTYETVDRKPQVRLAVPDMADDEGDQHILRSAVVTVVFQQGSGLTNPSEANSYSIWHAVNHDANIESNELGKVILPVVVGLSGDGGKRGTSVTALAKGVEGNEAVLFWLDTVTEAVPPSKAENGPDGVYNPDTESVLCRATAESNDTATCVFEVSNPPFLPGEDLWVNIQDSEGRRVGFTAVDRDKDGMIIDADIDRVPVSTPYDWENLNGAKLPAGHDRVSLAMHPIHEAFVKLDARVTIQPTEVNIGDTVTVAMSDYAAGQGIEVIIGQVKLDLSAPGVDYRPRPGQGTGEEHFTFVIPATVVKYEGTPQEQVTPIPLGKVRVDVNRLSPGPGDAKADTNITIAGASVTLSQHKILGNQTLSISGSGFSGRGAGSDRCIREGDVKINNVAVEIIDMENAGLGDTCSGDVIELTSSGTFTLTVVLRRYTDNAIPDPLQTEGTHSVVITDSKGVEGRTTVEIPERTLDVNPKTARPRTAVTVSGRNFVADNPDGSSVAIALEYVCSSQVKRSVTAEPDTSGNFEETLRVPDDCGIPSTNTITATVEVNTASTITETTTHDIPEAEVQVAPDLGAIGSEITITGEGFRTFEGVSGIELGTKNVLGGRVFYTDRDGKLNIEGLIVPGIDPGTYALVVGVGEDEERTTASVNYTVIDEGLPQKAPVAIVEGLEPLGEKLVRVFRFNNATKTWEFYDPRPEFAEANTITQMFGGNVYWLNVTEDAEVVLGGKTRRLTCIEGDCWNQIVW